MNIQNLRKQYGNMSAYERLAVADHAVGRGDDNEAAAVKKESPKINYTAPDFYHGFCAITNLRMVSLLDRLGEVIRFNSLVQIHFQQRKAKLLSPTLADGLLRLTAYRYTVATESLDQFHKELGLRTTFEEEMAQYLPMDSLALLDTTIRDLAFTEEEALEWAEENGHTPPYTVEKMLESYRATLAEAME